MKLCFGKDIIFTQHSSKSVNGKTVKVDKHYIKVMELNKIVEIRKWKYPEIDTNWDMKMILLDNTVWAKEQEKIKELKIWKTINNK